MRAEIVKINSETPETSLVKYAAEQIRAGQVLGMPTDTFYGLAADPFNLRAVDRVYEIKSRSRHKPLSLLIESVDQAEELAHSLPQPFYELARKFWPGPLTVIVRAGSRSAPESYGEHWECRAACSRSQDPTRSCESRSHPYHGYVREFQRSLRVHQCRSST